MRRPDRRNADMLADESLLTADLVALVTSAQSPRGGWGVMAGRDPDVESTAWALCAAARIPGLVDVREPALRWLLSQQRANGSWTFREGPEFNTWPTFAAVIALAAVDSSDAGRARALRWIVEQHTVRATWWDRWRARFTPPVDPTADEPVNVLDASLDGYGWADATFTWVEPTAMAMLALMTARGAAEAQARIATGARVLLDRQAPDGGWNYGNKRVLGYDLPGYPDTTGWAVLGLLGALRLGVVDQTQALTSVSRGLSAIPAIEQPGIAPLPMALELLARTAFARGGFVESGQRAGRAEAEVRTSLVAALRPSIDDAKAGYPTLDTRTAVLSLLALQNEDILPATA